MIPKGILIDCACIFLGGNLGAALKQAVPKKILDPMNVIFGLSAIAIGILSLIKLSFLPAVILALILGGLIGELLDLETLVKNLFHRLITRFRFSIQGDREAYLQFYLIVAVTFCASGANIFGAITEGMSGDMTVLLSKAVMDIFAATIFGATLGRAMNLILPLQLAILCAFFYGGQFLMPLVTQEMLNDFMAAGGLLTIVLGLNIAKIKQTSAVNLLPALVIVWPASWLFSLFF
ncbi:MAG: DUF554 domain-containing protein [Evtepia sp.]|uniref:DUF554 domain-containing protein n=1 Tax=Evtepia sp. TaxID=2773933 RepID=UPI002A760AE6|nr:DUF554 domain-containing protein [Evtepia sp.]MDY3014736.1 DUF554 domain-containing protein [Evtepia sp.]